MLLRELFEAEGKHATFCFGRMNPPTIGHEQVFKTMESQGGDYFIFVSQSQDKKENPLSYSEKIKFIKSIHEKYADHVIQDSSINTVVKAASYLFDQGYTDATFVAGSDRLEQFKKLLTQYNGVEGKAHGYYKFNVLDFVSSGEREDGAEGVAGVSASGARLAAANNDLEGFEKATGAGQFAKPMFDAVRKGMGINENIKNKTEDVDMKIKELVIEYKKNKNPAKFNIKPRTGHAPTQTGAGAHRDKKKEQKQGYEKHKNKSMSEAANQALSIQQLATISDEALDKAYGYGRSSPGNTFGWQANLKSATYAKQMIDKGVTDIEAISDAIHKGWNVTAQEFVKNPDQFDDTAKLKADGKLEAKLQQRAKLMKIDYAQLDNDEQEKDRVVARAMLQAIKGQDVKERVRDPEDWDEGNTEPPNNFAVHINGKKWKVFAGRGTYADDAREMKQYYDLKAWAAKKSEATGKKWEVFRTGEPATESIETESAPKGWEGTVKAMKKHKDIDNPWALAHYMKNKGYTSHKKANGSDK